MRDLPESFLTEEERQILLEMPREELTALIASMIADIQAHGFDMEHAEHARHFILRQLGLPSQDLRPH